ncbi:MAG: MBL fold metallo-hydrolase [Methylococcales bacterium]
MYLTRLFFVLLFFPVMASANVYTRVVDVGAGLCTVTQLPGNKFIVYDAGHWTGFKCLKAIKKVVKDNDIFMLVLSHSDADHIGNAKAILDDFNVENIIRTGYPRPKSKTWVKVDVAISNEVRNGAHVINLQNDKLQPGLNYQFGEASVKFLYGQGKWNGAHLDSAEARNVISITMRIEYKGQSILFPGDIVGRDVNRNQGCLYAEKILVDQSSILPITSNVLIAPHHGANNASSACFISKVQPDYVVFSAGHKHKHPRSKTVKRYIDYGVPVQNIFRTDIGDDEGNKKEWSGGRVANCKDRSGDDDIEIFLPSNGKAYVRYYDDGGFESCNS